MPRGNKKETIAALHREQIMKAAETLFSEKGYERTTIEDISALSGYSRRTIYVYYASKEEILYCIIEKGLLLLRNEIEIAVKGKENFMAQYEAICAAMRLYQEQCPHSWENVNKAKAANFDFANLSDTVKRILALGTEINALLADFIEQGKNTGVVRQDVVPMMTVYILWSSIVSFITLWQTKGSFITKQFSISEEDFLAYGLHQIINSILEVKIEFGNE